jgi:FkbM family methyltransferase
MNIATAERPRADASRSEPERATEPFFPNQSAAVQSMEFRFRTEAAKLPQTSRLALYEIFSSCLPSFTPTVFRVTDGVVIARQNGREIAFPDPLPLVKFGHIIFGYEEWLQRKYCLPGFVEVAPGDVVVDCGAYVGGFSISAAMVAAQVHAFEPEAANFACLARNFRAVGNVVLNQAGLYSETRRIGLNISASSVEHSLLMPDDGNLVEVREIDVTTLRDYLDQRAIAQLDFLKLEAEGVELEIFDGLHGILPRKIAIDVSPERNGESPADDFCERLMPLGYKILQRGNVMFARLES